MNTPIFTIAIIILNFGATIDCLLKRQLWGAGYFFSAAMITICAMKLIK